MSGQPEPLPPQVTDLAESLIGAWYLTSREDFDAEGNRLIDPHLGANPRGMLCFSTDRFSAQFSNRNRSGPPAVSAERSDENNSTAVDGYDAYFGSYAVNDDKGAIAVVLEGSIAPENTGQKFMRTVRASEHELLIRLDASTDDGTSITRTLTFERLR
jgi:hypothetical protein